MNAQTALLVICILGVGFFLAALLFFFFRKAEKESFQNNLTSQTGFSQLLQNTLQVQVPPLIQSALQIHLQNFQIQWLEQNRKQELDQKEREERNSSLTRQETHAGLMKMTASLEARFLTLEQQVNARLENIGKSVETKLHQNMQEGFQHFEKVQQHLQAAELKLQSLNQVGQSISDLNQLLKLPHLRGGFGEMSLERLLADFFPPNQFQRQYAISPHSTERVDAVVKIGTKWLPIDSKFPREQILPLFESQDPVAIENARKLLGDFIKSQGKEIAQKYIKPEHGTLDMALLYLPSETLYFEVIRNAKLFEDLTKLRVFPVSPNTLYVSLYSVGLAQEYYNMAQGVERTIEDIQKAKRHFEHFESRFEEVGKGLRKAQEAFETASTHLNRYENSVSRLSGASTVPPAEVGTFEKLLDQ